MAISLSITSDSGTVDVTQFVQTVTWSGDYQQCARTLVFGLTSSPIDTNIKAVTCELGDGVVFKQDDQELFNGYIFERQKDTGSGVITITCYDRGIYLKRNEAVYKFTNTTPEAIVRRICTDYNIAAGSIAETGIQISRNFVGQTLYQIIGTAYTLASEQNEEDYIVRYEGEKLTVLKKEAAQDNLVITGGSNLMSASTTESITNMINQIVQYDAYDKKVGTQNDLELIKKYGLLQSVERQSGVGDSVKKAKKQLKDNGVSNKLTIENLGDVRCITGNTVIVREPYTGLSGLFYIDSDTHTWKKGLYLNKLTINFEKIMHEQDAGVEPD